MASKTVSLAITRKKIGQYCYDKLTGTFMGFLIGMSATGLIAQFFETRSIRNLWGLTAKKTLVDKNTFAYLEWFISLVIGFIVFEVFTNYVKGYIDHYFPRFKRHLFRWLVKNNLHEQMSKARFHLKGSGIAFFAAMQTGTKAALSKFSKR
jgi:hypothetical protein